ncbi:hypothetical protein AAU60_09870 [Acinetobacter johnsonii]|nr:hypothetical protein DT536_10835 [Acinetobacter johnsonii]KUG38331.1 hypothetical protein AAU60_09870 [Acinetobacter johnsonii]
MKMAFRFKPTQNKEICILWSMLKKRFQKDGRARSLNIKGCPILNSMQRDRLNILGGKSAPIIFIGAE